MYNLTLKGFRTKEEAQEFLNWYDGQGEQDASYWFEVRQEEGIMNRDFISIKGEGVWNGDTLEADID